MERAREKEREREKGGMFFLLQGHCFSKSAWGETAAPRLPEAFGRLLIATPSSSAPVSEVHDGILPLPPLLFSSCRPHVCAGVHIRTGSNGRVAREQSEAISVWDDSPCGAAALTSERRGHVD